MTEHHVEGIDLEVPELGDANAQARTCSIKGEMFFNLQRAHASHAPIYRVRMYLETQSGLNRYFYSQVQGQIAAHASLFISTEESLTDASSKERFYSVDDILSGRAGWTNNVHGIPHDELTEFQKAIVLRDTFLESSSAKMMKNQGKLGLACSSDTHALILSKEIMDKFHSGEIDPEAMSRIVLWALTNKRFESGYRPHLKRIIMEATIPDVLLEELGIQLENRVAGKTLLCRYGRSMVNKQIGRNFCTKEVADRADKLRRDAAPYDAGNQKFAIRHFPCDDWSRSRSDCPIFAAARGHYYGTVGSATTDAKAAEQGRSGVGGVVIEKGTLELIFWFFEFMSRNKANIVNGHKAAKSAGIIRSDFMNYYAGKRDIANLVSPLSFMLSDFG